MKNNSSSARTGYCVSLLQLFLLALAPLTAFGLEPPPPGAGLCFGFGNSPFFADVSDGISGQELVVTNINETVYADDDMDGFSAVRAIVTVRVRDRSGNVLLTSPQLKLFSPDTAIVINGGGFVPDSYFLSGFASNTFAAILFTGGFSCYGTVYAVEAGGQKYLAVVIGFMTQTGDDEVTGADESRANVWILNRSSGAIVFEHQIRKRPGRYLAGISISGLGDVDSDADDELVVAWAQPFGNGTYKMYYETRNILNGALEDAFNFFTNNTRTFN